MTTELKKQFWSNLKVTFKFIGIVTFCISALIIFDAIQDENDEDLFFPLYFLAFVPVIFLGTFVYTKLKLSSLNKYVCSLVFGAVISVATIACYFLGSAIDATDINMRFVTLNSILIFVTAALIYLQLPWEKHA